MTESGLETFKWLYSFILHISPNQHLLHRNVPRQQEQAIRLIEGEIR